MMCPMTYSQVAACTIIIIQIWSVTALTPKNVSTQIIKCEDETVQLKWEYELNPNEYVDGKTWSYTKNEKTILIARWTYTDGPIIEHNFINTVTIIGNDSLNITNIATKDGGTYTLTLFIRQSSQPTTKLSLNLTVLQPPLTGCCKPTIERLTNGTGLRANLASQGCGTGPFQLKWDNASETMSDGDVLIFLASNLAGTFKVCVTGLSIEKCFKGKRESLCQEETIEEMQKGPKQEEIDDVRLYVSSTCQAIIAVSLFIMLIGVWRLHTNQKSKNKVLMDAATTFISNIIYYTFKCNLELVLEENNATHIELENSEIIYIADATERGECGDLMENRQTNPSYAQTFYHKDKLVKLLVVQGEVGKGYTTWCRKLVSTWCTVHENQRHGKPIITNDENIQTMQSFPLLFFLSLRNVEKGQSLANTILQQLEKDSIGRTGLSNFHLDLLMVKRPDKIIFIIIDVDEADADVDILNEILSQTKNSLTILTCSDWEPIQSKCRIHEKDYRPMANITLKHI